MTAPTQRLRARLANVGTDAVIWLAAILLANGVGMLLSAIWDTVMEIRAAP